MHSLKTAKQDVKNLVKLGKRAYAVLDGFVGGVLETLLDGGVVDEADADVDVGRRHSGRRRRPPQTRLLHDVLALATAKGRGRFEVGNQSLGIFFVSFRDPPPVGQTAPLSSRNRYAIVTQSLNEISLYNHSKKRESNRPKVKHRGRDKSTPK